MPNPTELALGSDYSFAIMASTTTAANLTLDPKKQYTVQHNGIDESGVAKTDMIMLAVDGETPALTSGTDKFLLKNGGTALLPPNITTLSFKAASNDPTFCIAPVAYTHGRH